MRSTAQRKIHAALQTSRRIKGSTAVPGVRGMTLVGVRCMTGCGCSWQTGVPTGTHRPVHLVKRWTAVVNRAEPHAVNQGEHQCGPFKHCPIRQCAVMTIERLGSVTGDGTTVLSGTLDKILWDDREFQHLEARKTASVPAGAPNRCAVRARHLTAWRRQIANFAQ